MVVRLYPPLFSVIILYMADWAGKTLGKVHIEDLIARGGMAEVYTGTHESFGRVAIKVMRGLLERDSDQLARFQREAEVIEDLRHQNIVQMLEYAIVNESPYLVMEYIPGPSLAAYLKKLQDKEQRLPIGIVAHILTSMASALDYAHLKGIVHRDIKPANVLLRSQSEPVELGKPLPADVEPILTDFGLVRLLDSTMHTTAGSVSGTPAYMSPEQARGEKVDKRTDIYALGIMLYEMLAGVVPFQADTTFGMLMKHINEPPPPIQGISPDLQALIDRALAKSPAHRYESAGELANEFMALFNGQTISPGTLHIAQLVREEAEAERQGKPQPQRGRSNWVRIGIEVAIAAILLFVIYQVIGPNRTTAIAPNVPIGRLRFGDSNFYMDKVSLTLNDNIPQPKQGMHYEVWLITDDGTTPRDIGPIVYGASGIGRLDFSDPGQGNLLRNFNQVQITEEEDGVQISAPAGEVVFSSIFPPEALKSIRHLLVEHDTPDAGPLMQNLWWYSSEYVSEAINGYPDDTEKLGIVQALAQNDEDSLRKRTEEVINQIVGDLSDQYQDYDQDGQIDVAGDGYGSLPQGEERPGYIQGSVFYAQSTADAPDSTPSIRGYNENVQVCLQNMLGWTNEILDLALQLNDMPFGPEMEPIVTRLSQLGKELVDGSDANENGIIDLVAGECGADDAYEKAYWMADFQIYLGPNRIPPSGQ
jgi:tRNA A-37 threonylcarbamoyl transferase component Bud32